MKRALLMNVMVWRFKSQRMLHHANWEMVTNITQDYRAFIFRIKESRKSNISDDLNLQGHRHDHLRYHNVRGCCRNDSSAVL
jgi:hypothetical protein